MSEIVKLPLQLPFEISLFMQRDDLLHPMISGNKFRKLKYNIAAAQAQNAKGLITFGGAFSNHILATAAAGEAYNLPTVGIVRGEELADKWQKNPTLARCVSMGMQLHFVSRADYALKEESVSIKTIIESYTGFYVLPEGGTNILALKGCGEILDGHTQHFDYICVAVGTGGTISGLINASKLEQKIIGYSALKGDFLIEEINNFATRKNWELRTDYHFGGYAKVTDDLVDFLNDFYTKTNVPLDPIYTGKMVFGVLEDIKQGFFKPNSSVLLIHTGGLQGIEGVNNKRKGKCQIGYEI